MPRGFSVHYLVCHCAARKKLKQDARTPLRFIRCAFDYCDSSSSSSPSWELSSRICFSSRARCRVSSTQSCRNKSLCRSEALAFSVGWQTYNRSCYQHIVGGRRGAKQARRHGDVFLQMAACLTSVLIRRFRPSVIKKKWGWASDCGWAFDMLDGHRKSRH